MKALIQRVSRAKVTVDEDLRGEIRKGIVVLLGVTPTDSEKDVRFLVEKIAHLRIFPGDKSDFDRSVLEAEGALLVVSQFTLYGSTKKGRRPDFNAAAKPDFAQSLYERFVEKARETGLNVATGQFQAHMMVELVNDGPVTFMIESPQS